MTISTTTTTTTRLRRCGLLLLLGTLAALSGCKSEEDRIPLLPVSGTVTQNGKPMANATVSFIPAEGNTHSTPGVDATGPEGNYKIRYKNRMGLSAGKYRVVIEPSLEVDQANTPPEFADDPYMAQMSRGHVPGEKRTGAEAKLIKNEFEAEVSESNDVFDFDVKTAAKK